MSKLTISMAIFNSYVYQKVNTQNKMEASKPVGFDDVPTWSTEETQRLCLRISDTSKSDGFVHHMFIKWVSSLNSGQTHITLFVIYIYTPLCIYPHTMIAYG